MIRSLVQDFFRFVRAGLGGGDAATAQQVHTSINAANIATSRRQLDQRAREHRHAKRVCLFGQMRFSFF
jgi:hypothetical protein